MVLWINLNWNNRSMLAQRYSALGEKTGPILLPLVGPMAGRQANSLLVKLFRFLTSFNNSAMFL